MRCIRTSVNVYSKQLDTLGEDRMYDLELQRDLARDCVLEVDNILAVWRLWRGSW